jgi:phosphoribosylformimino-5-aminoimidazole carboxamide ribotide isomerase
MLIPSIDLKGGKVVQLVQGDRVAIESSDVFRWVRRFQDFPMVQLIDLDAAMSTGNNDELVRRVSAKLACRVGGGIRSVDRARQVIDAGARRIILSSALFKEGHVDVAFAAKVSDAVGRERVVAAVDTRGGRLVIHGWRTTLAMTPIEAMKVLEPYCDEFLYTDVDHEGLMQGMDMAAVDTIRQATARRLSAAGGITTQTEVDDLDAKGIDAVVGMAIYTGTMQLRAPAKRPSG